MEKSMDESSRFCSRQQSKGESEWGTRHYRSDLFRTSFDSHEHRPSVQGYDSLQVHKGDSKTGSRLGRLSSSQSMNLSCQSNGKVSMGEHFESFVARIREKYKQEFNKKSENTGERKTRGWQLQTTEKEESKHIAKRVLKQKNSSQCKCVNGTTIYVTSLTSTRKAKPQVFRQTNYDADDPRLELKIMNEKVRCERQRKKEENKQRKSKLSRGISGLRSKEVISLIQPTVDLDQIILD